MKKAIISILVLLPLVLVVIIAITGRIYGSVEYVDVSEVFFVDEDGKRIDSMSIYVDQTETLNYVVGPSLATNKNVTFRSENADICSVNGQGVITGNSVGQTDIVISSINNIEARLTINVRSSGSTNITLSRTSLNGYLGCNAIITALAQPSTETQYITWQSSDTNIVSVNGQGGSATLSFNGIGQATIYATSRDGLSASCAVTVTEDGVRFVEDTITVPIGSIDLINFLVNYQREQIYFEKTGGSGTIEGSILTCNGVGVARVRFYIIADNSNETLNFDEAIFRFV